MMLGVHDMTQNHREMPERPGRPSNYVPYLPQDMDAYREYVQAVVERYDGDGVGDMPGLKYPIKYWEVDNEVGSRGVDVEDYCTILKDTYGEIKSADTTANVLFAGLTRMGKEYYPDVKNKCENIDQYFDISNFHFYPARENPKEALLEYSDYISLLKTLFPGKPIWITESSVPSENTNVLYKQQPDAPDIYYTTEKLQAEMLVKIYTTSIAKGVDKLFWWMLMDVKLTGIRGIDSFAKNSLYDSLAENAKLSGYALRLLVDKLEGSDWGNIESVYQSDDIYVYKFMNNGKPIWVAWNDGTQQTITLDVGNINSVKITEAVPDAESGAELDENDYPDFFNIEIKSVSNGKVSITLGESPVFVELNI